MEIAAYIEVAKKHQATMRQYLKGGPVTVRDLDDIVAIQDEFAGAVDAMYSKPIGEVRAAEKAANIHPDYRAFA